jgi:hypothetical protein
LSSVTTTGDLARRAPTSSGALPFILSIRFLLQGDAFSHFLDGFLDGAPPKMPSEKNSNKGTSNKI